MRWWVGVFEGGFLLKEAAVRLVLLAVLSLIMLISPIRAKIQPENWHQYRYPFAVKETFPSTVTYTITPTLIFNALLIHDQCLESNEKDKLNFREPP